MERPEPSGGFIHRLRAVRPIDSDAPPQVLDNEPGSARYFVPTNAVVRGDRAAHGLEGPQRFEHVAVDPRFVREIPPVATDGIEFLLPVLDEQTEGATLAAEAACDDFSWKCASIGVWL